MWIIKKNLACHSSVVPVVLKLQGPEPKDKHMTTAYIHVRDKTS